ncbi:LysR family transcriptional regulator [Rhizobium sp. 16-449-1b]|uniref:LysR substrate-binding domain-containing protein n=1 Tax=Rhizobium sp. 16-449-1b TaxID=2819989 RepID=UPI001ADB15FD|nr:LysR substrate-binding domain-containing protein [Rhizobium sp. 16-449-1b]MBO9195260.1 LysR family transcriptional regulator [Rhizobium sp. 16-449-1b]
MKRIPIGGLPAFEAAARHLSFKLAAKDLNLSPSAVSHAITKLEREIGTLLFDRSHGELRLTADGLMFQRPVVEAMALLRGAMETLSARQSLVLRLHSSPSFAAQWLAPRLNRFLIDNPGFEVTISADTKPVHFAQDQFDVDIVYGLNDHHEGLVIHSLGPVEVQPMCTPEMARQLETVEDLHRVPLIRSMIKNVSWSDWFHANGSAMPRQPALRFDRSFMAIAAAADGMGVCLEAVKLAERELSSGRLVQPFAGRAVALTEANHFLVYPQRNEARPVVRAFRDWLLAAVSEA